MLQRSKCLPGHAEKLYTLLNTNTHDCKFSLGYKCLIAQKFVQWIYIKLFSVRVHEKSQVNLQTV